MLICLRATWIFLIISLLNKFVIAKTSETRVVCYYTNWSVYRSGSAKFTPQNINPYLCTHLIYAFGGFTKDATLKPFDKYQDIEKGGYAKFTGLKTYNKHLKVMIAIGGWNEGSSRFSSLSANADKRKEFAKNVVKFLRQNNFDGLDLDWEYPAAREGGKARDKENYALLVQELREEFDREASKTGRSRLLLTMAAPAGTNYIEKGYNIPKLNKYLDWFNILSYDFHSSHEPQVNHHAPLYSLDEESEYNYDAELNIDHSITYYLKAGADPDKLVLGIPTYGRSYTLVNPDSTDIGSPADEPGEKGEFTKEKGYLAYYEICQRVRDEDWTVVDVDPNAVGPYAYKDDQWVGYDDEAIARKKSEYVVKLGLGGIMFWSIDNDDFRGDCHGKPFPIIEAAKEALLNALGISEISFEDEPESSFKSAKNKGVVRQKPTKPTKLETSDLKVGVVESGKPTPFKATGGSRTRAPQNNARSTVSSGKVGTRTTPEPPTTPSSEGDFRCEDEGFFAHPKDCKKYYWCLDGGASGLGLVAHQFTCPSGLYFNPAADSCDYTRNVLCKKTTTTTSTTTTEAPTTSTTSRTTLGNLVRTTARTPSLLRTTTPRTTTTRSTTTPASIILKDEETDGEEDPQIIKELISLIKKAGGLEQLEKHFIPNADEKELSADPTVASLSKNKSLYQRVLNKALALNLNRRDKNEELPKVVVRSTTPTVYRSSSTTTTEKPTKKEYSSVIRNSRPRPQNDGIDKLPEYDQSFKEKPKYVTLVRNRGPNLSSRTNNDQEDDEPTSIEGESKEMSNSDIDVGTSRIKYIDANVLRSLDRSRQKVAKIEEDVEVKTEKPSSGFSYSTINRQRTKTTETADETTDSSSTTLKYKTIERTRASTAEPTPEATQQPDRSFGDSRYKYIGEEEDDEDDFVEAEIITVKPLQYASINRGTDATATTEVEESKTETPEAEFITSFDDIYETVNPKVSETIFIVTKPFTEAPETTQRVTVSREPSTVSERQTTPSRTTTKRRQTSRPSSRRPTLNLLETDDTEKVEEQPRRTPSTRARPTFNRPSSRSVTKRPQLLTEETYSDVQSSTVYAPRPFSGSRKRVQNNEIQEQEQDVEYPTSRPGNVRSSSRGTARFTIPTINVLRNANFKNNINNKYVRRGPSKAFTDQPEDGSVVTGEEEVLQTQTQRPTRTRTTRRRLVPSSARETTVVAKEEDQEPLSINNFLVPDRAINPNNRFSLSSKFGFNGRSTARPIVDEVFDIETANPNYSTKTPKAFSFVSAGFGQPTKEPATPFPSKADIDKDTVILTLGGQLAVASPAQNSLQQRINDELAKINSGSVSDVLDEDLLDTVAPYSVTISNLQDEDDEQILGIQQRTTERPVPTTLRPSRFRTTQVRTTLGPSEAVETTDRTTRRRPSSRNRTPATDAPNVRTSDENDKSTSRGSPTRRPGLFDRTSRGSSTAQPSTFEYSTPAVTTVVDEDEEEEQITQTIARLLSTGVPSKYTKEDYTTISESFTTEAIPTTIFEREDLRRGNQRERETTTLRPVTTTTEASSSPRSRRIKKIRLTRPTKGPSDAETKTDDSSASRRRLAASRGRSTTEVPTTIISPSSQTPRFVQTRDRSRSRGTIKRLVKKRPVTTTSSTTAFDEDKEELYEEVDLDINLDNNIQKQSTSRFSDPQEVSRPTRRFQVTRERNDLVTRNEVQEENKVEIKRPVYATRTPITRARVVPSRTTEAPTALEEHENEDHDALEEDGSNESDGILDDDDFTVSNKEILSSIGISRPTTAQRPGPSQRPSLRPASRFSVRPRPANDLSETQQRVTSDNKLTEKDDRRLSSRPPASYRRKSNRPVFGRTQTSTTEAPVQPLATRSKNVNVYQRTRVRNYPGRYKAQTDEKKEVENEIEAVTTASPTGETDNDDETFTTLIDEIGNRFTITDGKLTTLKGKRPFETTRVESVSTTTPRSTTLMHVFALDEDELTTPKPTDPSEQAEEISKRLEKLVEINVIEEINTRTEKHKYNKKASLGSEWTNSSEIILEKLPTNHKVGEISRLAVIKLMHGTTESDEVKKSRILSSDAIFRVETSTIPLERLFELEREAKEIREIVQSTTIVTPHEETITPAYLVTNTEETDTKTTVNDLTAESTVITTTAASSTTTTTTPKPATVPSLLSLLRPDDNDPLVISIANLDKVTLQKVEPSQPSIVSAGYSSATTN